MSDKQIHQCGIGVVAFAILIPVGVLALGVFLALRALGFGSPDTVFGQPAAERAAQMHLPRSGDPVWATLRTTAIFEDTRTGEYRSRYPDVVKALSGHRLTIAGYLLPLDNGQSTTHFMLSKYTPVCPFCPPGQPNEVIEVNTTSPVFPGGQEMITLTGLFSLRQEYGSGLFFHLDQAAIEG